MAVIKLRTFGWRDDGGLPGWAQCNQSDLMEGKESGQIERRCEPRVVAYEMLAADWEAVGSRRTEESGEGEGRVLL